MKGCACMWIEERKTKNGDIAYAYIERYTCPLSGKKKKVSVVYGNKSRLTQKQALMHLQERIDEIMSGYSNSVTFMELLDSYIEYHSNFVKVSTRRNLHHARAGLLASIPGDTLYQNITPSMVQHALNVYYETHAYSTTKQLLHLFRSALRYNFRLGTIKDISIIERVELKRKPISIDDIDRAKDKFLEPEELKEVISLLETANPVVAKLCEFQSLTGLRFGEMVALRDCDYDKDNHRIHVNGSLCIDRGTTSELSRTTPKNVYSIRYVDLDSRSESILESFMLSNKVRQLWKHQERHNDYIFTTEGGYPFDHHFVNKVLKKLHYHKHLSTHIFRHTHISLLAAANVPLKAAMARVGHNDPSTTLSVYTHVTASMNKEAVNAMELVAKKLVK